MFINLSQASPTPAAWLAGPDLGLAYTRPVVYGVWGPGFFTDLARYRPSTGRRAAQVSCNQIGQ